jgi:hypothetical protein
MLYRPRDAARVEDAVRGAHPSASTPGLGIWTGSGADIYDEKAGRAKAILAWWDAGRLSHPSLVR